MHISSNSTQSTEEGFIKQIVMYVGYILHNIEGL